MACLAWLGLTLLGVTFGLTWLGFWLCLAVGLVEVSCVASRRRRPRGTKRRGGAKEQARRQLMASSPETAVVIGRFWRCCDTPSDRAYLIRVFGRPTIEDWEEERNAL